MFFKYRKFKLIILINIIVIVLYIKMYQYFHKQVLVINKNKLIVKQRSEPSEIEIQRRIASDIPYLPIEDLRSNESNYRFFNFTCAWYPNIMNIQIQNEYWQIYYNKNLTYYIFGAYYDNRRLMINNNVPLIRILAMIDLITLNPKDYPPTYCQLWFREQLKPVIVPVRDTQVIWIYNWGHDPQYSFPHILSCAMPKAFKNWIPISISLVSAPCNHATNNVRVIYRPLKLLERKKEFAVCIKGLDFPYIDISSRLVEYMESLRVMGAEKVIMYDLEVHKNTTKVLSYYQREGFLEYRPFSFSVKSSNLPDYRHMQLITLKDQFLLHESVAYNDCIYRNMYHYEFIAVLDIDELPVPLKNHKNWHDLVKLSQDFNHGNCKSYASLCFYCAHFPSYKDQPSFTRKFPNYFYMLQHVKRVKEHRPLGAAMKCLHNTERVVATHNHFPIYYAADCRFYTFPTTDAQMHHYREPPFRENLSNPVIDKSLWRFKEAIIEKSLKVFEELDMFEKVTLY